MEEISAARVLQELAAIGLARADSYLRIEDGEVRFRDWRELQPEALAAVASVEKSSTGLRLKFYDKMKALELMGKMLGLFDGFTQQVEENNLLDAILASTVEEVRTDDLPELQQAAADCADVVEPPGPEAP